MCHTLTRVLEEWPDSYHAQAYPLNTVSTLWMKKQKLREVKELTKGTEKLRLKDLALILQLNTS